MSTTRTPAKTPAKSPKTRAEKLLKLKTGVKAGLTGLTLRSAPSCGIFAAPSCGIFPRR